MTYAFFQKVIRLTIYNNINFTYQSFKYDALDTGMILIHHLNN